MSLCDISIRDFLQLFKSSNSVYTLLQWVNTLNPSDSLALFSTASMRDDMLQDLVNNYTYTKENEFILLSLCFMLYLAANNREFDISLEDIDFVKVRESIQPILQNPSFVYPSMCEIYINNNSINLLKNNDYPLIYTDISIDEMLRVCKSSGIIFDTYLRMYSIDLDMIQGNLLRGGANAQTFIKYILFLFFIGYVPVIADVLRSNENVEANANNALAPQFQETPVIPTVQQTSAENYYNSMQQFQRAETPSSALDYVTADPRVSFITQSTRYIPAIADALATTAILINTDTGIGFKPFDTTLNYNAETPAEVMLDAATNTLKFGANIFLKTLNNIGYLNYKLQGFTDDEIRLISAGPEFLAGRNGKTVVASIPLPNGALAQLTINEDAPLPDYLLPVLNNLELIAGVNITQTQNGLVLRESGPVALQGEAGPIALQGEAGPLALQGEAGPLALQGEAGPLALQALQGTSGQLVLPDSSPFKALTVVSPASLIQLKEIMSSDKTPQQKLISWVEAQSKIPETGVWTMRIATEVASPELLGRIADAQRVKEEYKAKISYFYDGFVSYVWEQAFRPIYKLVKDLFLFEGFEYVKSFPTLMFFLFANYKKLRNWQDLKNIIVYVFGILNSVTQLVLKRVIRQPPVLAPAPPVLQPPPVAALPPVSDVKAEDLAELRRAIELFNITLKQLAANQTLIQGQINAIPQYVNEFAQINAKLNAIPKYENEIAQLNARINAVNRPQGQVQAQVQQVQVQEKLEGFCAEDENPNQIYISIQDEITKKLGGGIGRNPKTKNIDFLISLEYYKPWSASIKTLDQLLQIEPVQMSALLFQIVWVLAVCQSTWHGFMHGLLSESITIYKYGGVRNFKIRCQNINFYLPANTPAVVITKWSQSTSLEPDSKLLKRASDTFDPTIELIKVLEKLIYKNNDGFEPARQLYKEIQTYKSTPSGLLFSEVFSDFLIPPPIKYGPMDVVEITNLKL